MTELAPVVQRHLRGILGYLRSRITNAVPKGTKSLVQAAQVRARGYRNVSRFMGMWQPSSNSTYRPGVTG